MHVMRGQVHEVAMMRDDGLVVLHLRLERTADNHGSFTRRVPVKRGYASRSELGEDDGSPLAGIALFHRDGKALRRIRNGGELGGGFRINDSLLSAVLSCSDGQQADDNRQNRNKNTGMLVHFHDSPVKC